MNESFHDGALSVALDRQAAPAEPSHEKHVRRTLLGSFLGYYCGWSADMCTKDKAQHVGCSRIMRD